MRTAANPDDVGQLFNELDRAMNQLIRHRFCQFRSTDMWAPAINAYRLPDRIEVCVDLAGVERDSIDLSVEPGALTVRGLRHTPMPEPEHGGEPAHSTDAQILVMEIEHGPFERTLRLPRGVSVDHVEAEQANGMLCIRLPLRGPRKVDL